MRIFSRCGLVQVRKHIMQYFWDRWRGVSWVLIKLNYLTVYYNWKCHSCHLNVDIAILFYCFVPLWHTIHVVLSIFMSLFLCSFKSLCVHVNGYYVWWCWVVFCLLVILYFIVPILSYCLLLKFNYWITFSS